MNLGAPQRDGGNMKKWIVAAVVILLGANSGFAQEHRGVAPPKAVSPEARMRLQLDKLVREFQREPGNADLREKIIILAHKFKTLPKMPKDAEAYFESGTELMKNAKTAEDFRAAVDAFERASVTCPWYSDAYYSIARAQIDAGDYDKAQTTIGLYTTSFPESAASGQAQNLLQEIKTREALDQFHVLLAELQSKQTDASREAMLQPAAQLDALPMLPEEAHRHIARGTAAIEDAKSMQDFRDAAQEFEQAVASAPWFVDAYSKWAVAQ